MPIAATIERLRLAVPRPTNQTAAALLWTYGTLPAFSGSTKLAPWRTVGGTTEQLIWRAAGYRKPGDKFHGATDGRWWTRAFDAPDALWRQLGAMAAAHDAEHPTATEPPFAANIATGAPDALKAYLTLAWETLQAARAKGKAKAPPVGVPRLPKRPPVPGIPPGIPAPPLPLPGRRGGGAAPLLLLLALVFLASRRKR